jgi:hypothetical protein
MLGDPHSRSAHRASPASGLGLLTPQALVRQAQAGQARARQAIVRQAMARQARGHRVPAQRRPAGDEPASNQLPTGVPAPDQRATGLPAPDQRATGLPAPDQRATGLPAPDRRADQSGLGLQAVVRLAAEVQAAERLRLNGPAAAQHRQPHSGRRPGNPVRQRRTPPRRARREPQQALQSLLRGLAALIVLAIAGLSAFFIIAEGTRGQGGDSAAPTGSEPGIATRAVDAEPLTQGEVFPEPTVQLGAGAAGYQVTMTHSDSECQIATTGELGALLRDHGCDQVVRARLTAPYGGYQVTTGIFNLTDATGAARVSDLTGTLVENGRGTFATLGGAVGDPLTEPLAQVGWRSRGHYLLYCVIARPDGQLVADDDPYSARITAELVGQYLGAQVVGERLSGP